MSEKHASCKLRKNPKRRFIILVEVTPLQSIMTCIDNTLAGSMEEEEEEDDEDDEEVTAAGVGGMCN